MCEKGLGIFLKILMLGNKESGKTTYMASAFGLLSSGMGGFKLTTDYDSERWFRDLFHDIQNGRYPSPTNKRSRYCLSLCRQQRKILDFEWLDYNGGVITEKSIDNLKDDIRSTDGLMIFLEAKALLNHVESIHKFGRIVRLIHRKLEDENCPLFSVIVVITKYDEISNCFSFNSVIEPIKGFIYNVSKNDRIYCNVIPVFCTSKSFFNVEIPLFDLLDSGLILAFLKAAASFETEECRSLKQDREALALYIQKNTCQ